MNFDPMDWHWMVGDDSTRYWSSSANAYVSALPDGVGFSRVEDEKMLVDALAGYSLTGPIEHVPDFVTARRFRLQLRISGLRDVVVAWVATQNSLVQDAFEYSGTFVRSEPMMEAGFTSLGLTSQEIDQFFIDANKL